MESEEAKEEKPLNPFQVMIKAALVLRYREGKGSHHTAGNWKKFSRRDEIRAWLKQHPEANQDMPLRKRTGKPAGYIGAQPKPKKEKQSDTEA